MLKQIKLNKKKIKEQNILFKVNEEEFRAIKDNANRYTEGNVSEWLRYSSINLRPRKSDLDKDRGE